MDRLTGLTAFVRTAELGSFVAAGRVLGLSASAVGKAVARLEYQLGVRLFQRSTRSIRLTDEGQMFQERCRRILDDLEDAQASLSHSAERPRGRLRVSMPTVTYHLLVPTLPAFIARYPDIELDVDFNDNLVDLIDAGIDVSLRSGSLPDSRLMARALPTIQLQLCAAPAYLHAHGTPLSVRELDGHQAVRFRYPMSGKLQEWPLIKPDGEADVRTRTAFIANNMEAVVGATLLGIGIGCVPDFLARQPLATGQLQLLLDGQVAAPPPFSLVWPSSRQLSPKVRVFVDFMGEHLFGGAKAGQPVTAPG